MVCVPLGENRLSSITAESIAVSAATGLLTGIASFIIVSSVMWLNNAVLTLRSLALPAIVITPVIGGLASGLIAKYVTPEVRGHGTDAAIRAVLFKDGFIRGRTPLAKLAATISTVGSGGSGGLVGPMVHVGAGISSVLTRLFRLDRRYMRVMALSGMGAGVSGVLKAPLAGALAGLEILYRGPGLERGALIPSLVASVTSYLTVAMFLGFKPLLYQAVTLTFRSACDARTLSLAIMIGILSGLLSKLYSWTFYGIKARTRRLKTSSILKPAIGAIASGLIGLYLPQACGAGYVFLPALVAGAYAVTTLLALCIAKLVATCFTVGSGGSGGVVAPAIFIGASLGASAFKFLAPTGIIGNLPISLGAVEGIVGLLSGVCRIPLAAIALSIEITGCPALVAPSIVTAILAYIMAGPEATIYKSQKQD